MIKKNLIAFQGVPGAHADLACRKAYPYMDSVPYPSFEEVIKAVETGKAHLCLIPVENSHAGRVAEIHNILPKTKLHIVAEHFLSVQHHLLAPKDATLATIKTVYSHPQALMQCRERLQKMGLATEAQANTAVAAEQVAKWKDPTKAALASDLAAKLYGLRIIKKNMQDTTDNTTIFIAMAKRPEVPNPKDKQVITSVLFTARNIPAALYRALGGFATNGVNLLKLESYIPSGSSRAAHFFASLEGHTAEGRVEEALKELKFFSEKMRVLGVYPADPARYPEK